MVKKDEKNENYITFECYEFFLSRASSGMAFLFFVVCRFSMDTKSNYIERK